MRARAQLTAAVAVLSLLATMVFTAPYAVDARAASIGTTDDTRPETSVAEPSNAADDDKPAEPAALIEADLAAAPRLIPMIAQQEDAPADATTTATTTSDAASVESVPAIDPSIPSADLSITIVPERDPVLSESFLSYTVEVTNAGPVEATNVVVTAELPISMSFILTTGCWLGESLFPECHLNDIPAGESRSFEILTFINDAAGGEQAASVSASSETADPDPTNNAASTMSTINTRAAWRDVVATADLAISKVDVVDPVPAEGMITYIITVANAGPRAATHVEVLDTLPPGVTVVSTTGCRGSSGVPVCDLGAIPPRQHKSYEVVVTADPGTVGELTNTVSVSTRTTDPNDSNDTATETTTVQFGTIILEKQTLPDGDPQTFEFTGDLAGTIGDGDTLQATNLLAGTYTSTEIVPAGWGIADITCDDADSGGSAATGEVTFNVEQDETITCVVTNALLGSVTIVKDTVGADGFIDFTGDLGTLALTTVGNTASTTVNDVLPGTYEVTEVDPAPAFYLTDLVCTDPDGGSAGDVATRTATIDVDPGEDVTCTFTNSQSGTITISKDTIGADGTFDFSGDLAPFSVTTAGNSGSMSFFGVAPGTHVVTEDVNAAYELSDLFCTDPDSGSTVDLATRSATIDLDPGETVSCSFTNTELGTMIVEKQTLPDGDPQTFDFAGDASGSIADGETLVVVGLLPGTYTSTETAPFGWELTDIVCDDGNSTGDTGTATATFNIESGETVTCVFTNTKDGTIILEKQTLPDGDLQRFDFSGDLTVNLGDGDSASIGVAPGTYTSTETVPAGWDLTDITCDDGNSSGSIGTATATFNVEPGENVRCVFTNTKRGSIIVEKQTDPDAVTATYTFTGDAAGTIGDGGQIIVNDLVPGTYTSTETDPAPAFDLTNIICDDTNSSGDVGSRTATFNLEPGETVTCVFTNTQRGTIIVEKTTDPAGAIDVFSFTGDVAGSIGHGGSITVADLQPGTYTSTETVPAGWAVTDISCDDANSTGDTGTATATFELDPGETVTCVFTNTRDGQLVVEKQTLPDNALDLFDFTGAVTATLTDNASVSIGVVPGTYQVTESALAGWSLTDLTCDDANSTGDTGTATATFNIEPGETVTCVFMNTELGTLIIEKQTVPDADPQTFTFTGDVAGTIGDGQNITVNNVLPGSYTSTETVPAGWAVTDITCDDGNSSGDTGTATATFNIEPGETVTCVVTNTKTGTIVVEKQTDPDGDPQAFTFTGDAAGSIADDGSITVEVLPGAYTSTEALVAGYDLTDISCDDGNSTGDTGTATATFNIEPGETVTCVFSNTKRGTIIVEKQTLPDGDPQTFDFTGDAAGSISDGGQIVVNNLVPGTYTSTEAAAPTGWDFTSISCVDSDTTGTPSTTAGQTATFELDPGETITCTFNNTKRGSIIVEKQTLPDGDPQTFDFTGDAAGSISDGGQIVVNNLVPGTYTSTEAAAPAGWDFTSISCVDSDTTGTPSTTAGQTATFELDPGETITCTFNNTKRGSIAVATQTLPAGNGGPYDYSGDITATHADGDVTPLTDLVPGQYTVTQDSFPAGWDLSDISCDDGNSTGDVGTATATFNLDPGEDVICTFTNSERGSIRILKSLTSGSGTFGFDDGTGDPLGGPFDLTVPGDAEITFNDIVPGTYTVTEDVHTASPPAMLTGIACNDSGSTTASSGDVGTRTATINVDPGEDVVCTFTNSFNQAPMITAVASPVAADENSTATIIDLNANDDMDAEGPGGGLTWSFSTTIDGADNSFFAIDADTGVLTFSPAADFEAMADANGDNNYEVEVTVTDSGPGTPLTDVETFTVQLGDVNDAPVVTTSAGTTAFTEGAGAVVVDSGVTVTDQDGGNLQSASVQITNLPDAADESLSCGACAANGITANYSPGTGSLALTGAATIANYQTALQSVTYDNASLDPDEADRTIRFVVNDGALNSNNADKTVSVTAVNSPPTAVNDTFSVPVNVRLDAGGTTTSGIEINDADGVLTKDTDDSDPDSATLTVTQVNSASFTSGSAITLPSGATLTMFSDGTFNYVSAPGQTGTTDSFTYTVSDGSLTSTATVTINLGATIWFIDNTGGGVGGTGTSVDPFKTVNDFNTATTETSDLIRLAAGSGAPYTDAVTLLNNQQLLGEGVAFSSGGLTLPAGATPTLATPTHGVVLASGNTVRGVNIGNTTTGYAFSGSNVGTPTINAVTVSGTGGVMSINGGNLSAVSLGNSSSTGAAASGFLLQNLTGSFNPGGTVDITNSAGTAVQLTNSAAITFADLDINNPASNARGILASGGGSLQITTGTVNAGTASAVDISGMSLGVLLRRVDSVGGSTPGISLATTTGFFTVSGGGLGCHDNAGSCLGGSITGKTGNTDGILLNNVTNVTLNDLNISNNNGNGIFGTNVTNFTVDDIRLDSNADSVAQDEAGLKMINLLGNATMSNTRISNSHEHNAIVRNSSGLLSNLTVSNSDFGPNPAGTGANGLLFQHTGGTQTLTVTNSLFNDNRSFGIQADSSAGFMNVSVSGSRFTSTGQAANAGQNVAIGISTSGGADATFSILNNPEIEDHRSNAINVFTNGFGTVSGTIQGNTIGTAGDLSSGSSVGSGIRLAHEGTGTLTARIDGNTIQEIGDGTISGFHAISVFSGLAANNVNATITNNIIDQIRDDRALSASIVHGGVLCANISGNTFTNTVATFGDSRLRISATGQSQGGSLRSTQTSEANLEGVNGGHNFDISGPVAFNQPACAVP